MSGLQRYSRLSIALHWSMAIGFFLMLGSGIAMVYVLQDPQLKFKLYQWHKAGGVLLFCAFFLRIGWRFFSYIPPLPYKIISLEKRVAKWGHWGLYVLMFLVPFSGWVMVSSSVYGLPTSVFGWFIWPHIPGIQVNEDINLWAKRAHLGLTIALGAMITIHISAVIKHIVKDKVNLLPRIWWT